MKVRFGRDAPRKGVSWQLHNHAMAKQSVRCLLYMSASEATLGEEEPKLHNSGKNAIAEALEWIGRNPRHRAYIDCTNHQQFTHEDLTRIRANTVADRKPRKREP